MHELGNLVSWWWNERHRMSSLAEALAAMLASKLGFGGLECDFGSLRDFIIPKKSPLGRGFAEASMMLMLNKHSMPYDLEKLILLDNCIWKNHSPKHPIFDEEL